MKRKEAEKTLGKALRSLGLIVMLLTLACGNGGQEAPLAENQSPFGFHPASVNRPGYADNGFIDARNIGVRWAREGVYAYWFLIQPDLGVQEYDFSLHDEQWRGVPVGMSILANIAPQGPRDEGYALPGSYLPVDEAKYFAFVKATVERYDGDGTDDMPGLVNPILTWQVGNEPNAQAVGGFAELQCMTYAAIKEACPDCKVLIGGVAGMPAGYLANFDSYYRPIIEALAGRCVDAMDFHWYGNATGDYLGAKGAYEHIRSALAANGFGDIPVWITEMGAYSGDPAEAMPGDTWPPQTERQQAMDYLKRFVYPLSFGVEKIFPAFGLMEGFKYDGGYFDFTGLIYDGVGFGDPGLGVKKLSYYTHKIMTETLEGSDWHDIAVVRESDDVHIYRFMKNDQPIYVAWWDYFNDPSYSPGMTKNVVLDGLQGGAATAVEALPPFVSGAMVVDYATAFQKESLPVAGGAVTLSLGDSPVFVLDRQMP